MSEKPSDFFSLENMLEKIGKDKQAMEGREITDKTYFNNIFSAITAFETDEGIVLVDTGLVGLSQIHAEILRKYTDAPINTTIYTHGHMDHAFGLEHFLVENQDEPEIIAHENMPARFERYERTDGHNAAINARQFGGSVESDISGEELFGYPKFNPNTLFEDRIKITVGGEKFLINHGRGETDDHSWVYCPDRDVLCTGDFFVSVAPNAGNPQKVQRYPKEWADELRKMAALEPQHLCPGHGSPVVDDRNKIQKMLLETADYLKEIFDQTLSALNDGSPPHVDILHDIDIPQSDSPWLKQVYDEAEFIVRNIVRLYGGWWTGRPSELKPAPRESLAQEIAKIAGGAEKLVRRAKELCEEGEFRLAGHLADYALEAAPANDFVQKTVADIYNERAEKEEGLMSRNLFKSASEYANEGRPFR